MTVQTDFLKRCKALNLHDGKLSDWLDEIESLRQQLAEAENRISEYDQRIVDIGVLALSSIPKNSYDKMVQTQASMIVSLQQQLAEVRFRNERLVADYAEVEQQLAAANELIRTYRADSTEQQEKLAATIAACKQKDESLEAAHNGLRWWMDAFPLHVTEADNEEMLKLVKALAIQPDDSALKAWVSQRIASTFRKMK